MNFQPPAKDPSPTNVVWGKQEFMHDEWQKNTDAELVQGAKNGDAAAFEELFDRYHRMVFGLGFRMFGTTTDAEDITQETFMRVGIHIRSFRGDAKFSSWLYRLALNAAFDLKRRRKKQKVTEERVKHDAVGEHAAIDESSRDILSALDTLPFEQRQALVLTTLEGLSHNEAAQILSSTEKTISWRIHAAKKKLRTLLSGGER